MQPSSHDTPSNDDLFQPSLQDSGLATNGKPWRNWSQIWIALFGGPIPYAIVAYLNSKRLGLPKRTRQILLLCTGISLLIAIGLGLALYHNLDEAQRLRSSMRFGSRVGAIALFAIGYRMQRTADRLYQFSLGDTYASLWKFGLLLVLVGGTLQNALLAGIIYVLATRFGL